MSLAMLMTSVMLNLTSPLSINPFKLPPSRNSVTIAIVFDGSIQTPNNLTTFGFDFIALEKERKYQKFRNSLILRLTPSQLLLFGILPRIYHLNPHDVKF